MFEHGKTTGVVGSTGAGKTSLVRLLLRFAEPQQGHVTWCDQPIETWKLHSLRSSIALVDQHITLFPTTILENIRYGRPDATDEEVIEAAEIAEAAAFVASLPSGWETLVGEGGHRLSGGQRQRVAIARAVLKDAPLLILDEGYVGSGQRNRSGTPTIHRDEFRETEPPLSSHTASRPFETPIASSSSKKVK